MATPTIDKLIDVHGNISPAANKKISTDGNAIDGMKEIVKYIDLRIVHLELALPNKLVGNAQSVQDEVQIIESAIYTLKTLKQKILRSIVE